MSTYKRMNICGHELITDGVWNIPPDPDNTEYQKFLTWLDEGNEPEEWQPESVVE